MNQRHPSEYSSDYDAHAYGAYSQGHHPASGIMYADDATGSHAFVPQQPVPYDQAYDYGHAPGYGQTGTAWETGFQPAVDPYPQNAGYQQQPSYEAAASYYDTGTYAAGTLWHGDPEPRTAVQPSVPVHDMPVPEWDSGAYPAYGYGYGTGGDTGTYERVTGYVAVNGGGTAPQPGAGYDTAAGTAAYGATVYGSAATGVFDTGTFDTTAFDTGTFNPGTFNPGAFHATPFDTGTFDTGTFDTGTFSTGTFSTGTFSTGAYNSGAFGVAAPVPGSFGGPQPSDGPDAVDATGVLGTSNLLDDADDDVFGAGGHEAEVRHDFAADGSTTVHSRRRGGKRALFGVPVPSVAALSVAAVGAAAIGGVGMAQESSSNTTAGGSVKAPTTQLDRQLSGVSQDADDFAARASRSQERVDLKDRQEAAKQAAAAAAARKEALRPKFVLPVKQKGLSAYFGQSGEHWMALHTGIDFPVQVGTPVMAVTDGTVRTQWDSSYGNMAIVTAPDGTETWYCHLSSTKIRSGKVKAGTVIAYSGNTGNTTGPHLHLEVRPNGGSPIDPLKWLLAHGLDPR
ncbi:M23 family metallopeptidase [Actinacidiphila yeochonensis]|uniref:M23 family metallopeptidase n=1 Tax=Actinacidiphila yeochonensis TaxID=89050 RepID=UPI00055A1022|nr:M23 family metallopeptidase [Actinacidiphila yeochonensis]